MPDVRVVPTEQFSSDELEALRALMFEAFEGDVTDDDWDNCLGGLHVVVVDEGFVSHAAVVQRLLMADRPLRTGYVEAVVTDHEHRHRGYASRVMREVGDIIRTDYELGALATGIPDFYARLGWELWDGPTSADSPDGPQRTPDDDGAVMILRTGVTANLEPSGPLMCDWRGGEVW